MVFGWWCLPRMRGDRPYKDAVKYFEKAFTPHARGSTFLAPGPPGLGCVYPACAGIDLYNNLYIKNILSLPRMRGDRPLYSRLSRLLRMFTPHARGSTSYGDSRNVNGLVYPACAGIDPLEDENDACYTRLPRMRGDRPPLYVYCIRQRKFTPHARGSTSIRIPIFPSLLVYPACAGIDL